MKMCTILRNKYSNQSKLYEIFNLFLSVLLLYFDLRLFFVFTYTINKHKHTHTHLYKKNEKKTSNKKSLMHYLIDGP